MKGFGPFSKNIIASAITSLGITSYVCLQQRNVRTLCPKNRYLRTDMNSTHNSSRTEQINNLDESHSSSSFILRLLASVDTSFCPVSFFPFSSNMHTLQMCVFVCWLHVLIPRVWTFACRAAWSTVKGLRGISVDQGRSVGIIWDLWPCLWSTHPIISQFPHNSQIVNIPGKSQYTHIFVNTLLCLHWKCVILSCCSLSLTWPIWQTC